MNERVKIVRYVSECDVKEVWPNETFTYKQGLTHLRRLFRANPTRDFDLISAETGLFVSWAI